VNVKQAIEGYEKHRRDKGNKDGTLADTTRRLNAFFTEPDLLLKDLTHARCARYYEDLRTRRNSRGKVYAVDSPLSVNVGSSPGSRVMAGATSRS
jgi:hypothetical protein